MDDATIQGIGAATRGCIYTVACASALASLVRGLNLEGALRLEPQGLELELGGLPEDHWLCARLAVNALGEAIEDHLRRRLAQAVSAGERREA